MFKRKSWWWWFQIFTNVLGFRLQFKFWGDACVWQGDTTRTINKRRNDDNLKVKADIMVMIIIMRFFFTKWEQLTKVRRCDFIYIYIFIYLYSFPESIKKTKLPVILSLWLPPHMWGCSIPPPLPTRPQARDLNFVLSLLLRKSGKVLGSEIYQAGGVNIAGSISPNMNFFSGRVSKFKTIEEKGRLLRPCPSVCLSV